MFKTKPEQVLQALTLLAKDEPRALGNLRRSHRWFKIGGFGVMLASFFLAFNPSFGIPCWIIALAAALGGALMGLAVWFENSIIQWPILKEYLDLKRLRVREDGAEGKRP
jgi:hypothetical protein